MNKTFLVKSTAAFLVLVIAAVMMWRYERETPPVSEESFEEEEILGTFEVETPHDAYPLKITKRASGVFFENREKMEGADFESLSLMLELVTDGVYVRDNDQLWSIRLDPFSGDTVNEIKGINIDSVRIIPVKNDRFSVSLLTDGSSVYDFQGENIGDIDVASVRMLPNVPYVSDSKRIFYLGGSGLNELIGVDMATLVVHDWSSPYGEQFEYATDSTSVFLKGRKVPEFDSATFSYMNHHYQKDTDTVMYYAHYCHGGNYPSEIEGADAATFELVVDHPWGVVARDKNAVYVHGKKEQGIDLATLRVEGGTVKDANNFYENWDGIGGNCGQR